MSEIKTFFKTTLYGKKLLIPQKGERVSSAQLARKSREIFQRIADSDFQIKVGEFFIDPEEDMKNFDLNQHEFKILFRKE